MQRAAGASYFQAIYAFNFEQVQNLVATIRVGGTLEEAQEAYTIARPLYEQIEVLAPAFGDEDEAIDARPAGFGEGALLAKRRLPRFCVFAGLHVV